MMIRAYPEMYLPKAQAVLGEALDYAVNACGMSGEGFINMFIVSSVSKRMAVGEPALVAGKSGIEIAIDTVFEATGKILDIPPKESFFRSPEYWIGWAVAWYQWYSARSYGEIFQAISFMDLESMYGTLHEADVSKFAEIADELVRKCFPDTNLRRFRLLYGCTQEKLSRLSGVSLRSIQMYEQRQKDINRASAESLYRLSRVLGCTMEDLIEK